MINGLAKKFINPINLFWRYTNKLYPASDSCKKLADNGVALRNYVRDYVRKR